MWRRESLRQVSIHSKVDIQVPGFHSDGVARVVNLKLPMIVREVRSAGPRSIEMTCLCQVVLLFKVMGSSIEDGGIHIYKSRKVLH